MAGMARFSFLLALACALASLSVVADTRAQTGRRSLIYDLLEQRQSRDPSQRNSIERVPERPAVPDRMRDPVLRPNAPDPTIPRSPLLDSQRLQQEDRAFQERLDRRERFERQRLLIER